jgi:hypothetical protein
MNSNDPKKPSYQSGSSKNTEGPFIPPGDPESSERNSRKLDDLYGFASPSNLQIITYIVLVLGLIIIFFNTLLGSMIIGSVVGFFYSDEVIYYLKNAAQMFNSKQPLHAIIIAALILGVFISTPGFFFGIAVAAIKQLLFSDTKLI